MNYLIILGIFLIYSPISVNGTQNSDTTNKQSSAFINGYQFIEQKSNPKYSFKNKIVYQLIKEEQTEFLTYYSKPNQNYFGVELPHFNLGDLAIYDFSNDQLLYIIKDKHEKLALKTDLPTSLSSNITKLENTNYQFSTVSTQEFEGKPSKLIKIDEKSGLYIIEYLIDDSHFPPHLIVQNYLSPKFNKNYFSLFDNKTVVSINYKSKVDSTNNFKLSCKQISKTKLCIDSGDYKVVE